MHLFFVLVLGVIASTLAGCSDSAEQLSPARPVLTVELISPRQETWPDTLTASGEIAPWQEASIGSELTGIRLQEVLVNVGDAVEIGQLLARYSEDELRIELAQAEGRLAEANANLERANADLLRADQLEKTSALSEQTIQMYRTDAKAAQALRATAQALRDAAALRLRYARVVAPDDGVISARTATVGAVHPAGTELFRLVRQGRLEWRAEVPAESLRLLRRGMEATVATLDGRQVTGTLRQLSPTADTATRNAIAYVDIPADSGLVAGMYATGRFALGEREALVLPEAAVVMRDGNYYLMQVDVQNRVHEIKVATGRRRGEALEIVGSVDTSTRIVKSGGAFLGEGDLVQVAVGGAPTP